MSEKSTMTFLEELQKRGARFAPLDPRNPLSRNHLTLVEVNLAQEEAQELKGILFNEQTKKLASQTCECGNGKIIMSKNGRNGLHRLRYSCLCDGPIDPSEWGPIDQS